MMDTLQAATAMCEFVDVKLEPNRAGYLVSAGWNERLQAQCISLAAALLTTASWAGNRQQATPLQPER